MSEGAGDGSGRATGLAPGALTALLQEVAASPEKREEEPLSLPPGTVVGRFEILRELGRGGFGVVYEARDRDLGRQVAVKIVRPGRIMEEEGKVVREAEAIARLAHPNLITLYDVGRSEAGPYLVFEFLRGKTLQERMDDGPMAVQEAVHIATEVARGLAHAHAEGVIHRDLKPANVFVTNKGQVKILDFGMAHAFGRRRVSGGTPAYMAPEQWEDAPEDERTDVFALGVMLYRMLTGEYPFPEGEGKWAAEARTLRHLDVPGTPELADLVEKMLDRTPTARPRDGAAVLAALAPIENRIRAKPADGAPPVHAKRRKATIGDLFAELKRRHVFRVMIGYGIFSFAVLQVTEPIMHGAHLPDWVLTFVLVALVLGFPVAVILAWVFDLTAQGVRRTASASSPGAPSFGRSRFLLPLAVAAGVLAISVAGAGAWFAWRRGTEQRRDPGATGARPSVAVLSFADLSPGHDQEYLADGVAEEVLNGLAQVDGLRVVGRSTAFSYKGKGKKVEEIGRELGVGAVLEGSVRKSGDRVRITAQLVHASDASTIWSQSFDRATADLFAVQDEIGKAVVEALAVRLLPGRSSARVGGTTNPEALQFFLRGRDLLRRGASESPKAWEAFEKAVAADPRFALAWVGIADAIVTIEATMGHLEGDPVARRRRAREAADRAVALAPGSPDAFRARADVHQWLENDWRGQRADLDQAIALAPGDPGVALSNGFALQASGNLDGAIAEFERATRIDPLLDTGWLNGWLGLGAAQVSRGDHVAGAASLRRALELFPMYCEPRWGLGMSFIAAGQPREALAEAGRSKGCLYPGYALGLEALAHHDLGHPVEARGALDQVIRVYGDKGAEYQVAELHAWRGEADRAFAWLEKARAKRDTAMFWLKTDPLLRKIRGDPRWAELLRRADLPPDAPAPSSVAPQPVSASIAVLPFADMSPKHDQEYFADGVAEEIRNALSHIDGLKVIGRTSSFSFKGKSDDLKAIGQKLGVANVLEGSLRKDGNGIRITAQLVRVSDGTDLWSESYDRKLSGLFKIQEEIAKSVVGALKVRLLPAARPAPRSHDPDAYAAYLLGRQLLSRMTNEELPRAVASFEKAVAIEPTFAEAWAGLSHALDERSGWQSSLEGLLQDKRKALDAANRAVELAPGSGAGYAARAQLVDIRGWDWKGSIADARRAVELDPGAVQARIVLGGLLSGTENGAAIQELRRSTELDPLNTLAWNQLGLAANLAGDRELGAAAHARALEINPRNDWRELVGAGSKEWAEAVLRETVGPQDPVIHYARVQALRILGREAEARTALDELIACCSHNGAWQIALTYDNAGERDKAFEWLERARVNMDGGIRNLKGSRRFRGDPRTAEILRKMNLPAD